jgi:hypothetical protein
MVLEEDLKNLIKDHSERFYDGLEKVRRNRLEWDALNKRAIHIFNKTIEQCKKHNFYSTIFLIDSQNTHSIDKTYINLNFIQLSLGFHRMGIVEYVFAGPGKTAKEKSIIEERGGLSIAQLTSGQVSIIMFPSSSELRKYGDDFIIYKIYKRPSNVKDKDIWNAIKFMFKFSLQTSYVSQISPSWPDRIIIFYHKIKSKMYAYAIEEFIIKIMFGLLKKVHSLN